MKKRKLTLTKKKKLDYLFIFLMLLIPVVHFFVFWVGVNFNSILLSFQRMDINSGKLYFTMENFKSIIDLFKSNELKVAFLNTFIISAFQIIFLVPWSFVLSYFLYKKIPLTGLWRVFLFLPTILPAIFLTGMFKYAISTVGGSPVGTLWEALFHESIPS